MTIRNLPKPDIAARPGVRSDLSARAVSRWSPDIKAAVEDDATISILDPIGADMWGDGVTAKRIAGALRAIGDRPVSVNVNSPGGDVFEGLAIYNLLREHKAKVSVNVIGLAASAASVIAMAGDDIRIGRSAFFMIHNSWVLTAGDRHELRGVADWLEPFDQALVDVYTSRSGVVEKEIAAMMDSETWINGQAAVDRGFADDLLESDAVVISDDDSAKSMRAEKRYDLLAARAGLARTDARALLNELKGGKPGAAQTGLPGAVEIEADLSEISAIIKSMKG